jgi:Domain of unknown function (DUF5916)/Carbohydrate family 9 binding domain-like
VTSAYTFRVGFGQNIRILMPLYFLPRSVLAVSLAAIVVPSGAIAQSNGAIDYSTARLDRKLPASRATSRIELDGRLEEPAWAVAPVAKDFIQNDPREGEPATFDTEVRMVYDDDALYIGVFAKDDQPSNIIVSELRKDFNTGNSDSFIVIIDTFKDERNGYQFAVNPAGAKFDAQMSNEGRENNGNWDGVWDVRTRVAEDGWYAELRIPFRTLKFSPAVQQTWGINFQRRLRRLNENSFWSPLQRIHGLSRVSMAGTIEGLQGIEPGNNLRIKPYALGSSSRVGRDSNKGDFDAGFDVKYGLTSGLTWDFTVNTDFSQVEADEQQINLTRFSLFFPEKRDFFLENSGIFQFGVGSAGAGGGGGGGGRQNPSQDMILFFSRRIGLSDAGAAIPILGGTRLTGRAAGFSLGALNIQQRSTVTTPSTNYTALRLRRDILAQSDVGVMLLNKDNSGAHFNRVVGADANFRFFQNLDVNFAGAKTFSPEGAASSGDDWYSKSSFNYNSNRLALRGGYQTIGEHFNNEMGFVPRRGVNNGEMHVGARFRPQWNWVKGWLRESYPHWQIENFSRRGGGLESRYIDWHWPVTFHNSTFIEVGVNPNVEVIDDSFLINSRRNIRVLPGRYEFNEYFVLANTNAAAPVSFNTRYSIGDFYDGYRRGYTLGTTVRANEHFNVSGNVQFNDIELPQGAFTTTLITGRVNYFLSTKMFLNALLQYNTDARQWSSNVRFNVIHRPLSDIFLVYNERRDSRTGAMIERAVVAKMTYMIAF